LTREGGTRRRTAKAPDREKGTMSMPIDASTLSQVASIIAGFGVSMLTFRIQRHLEVLPYEGEEHSWLAVADWLLVWATASALLFVILPLLALPLGPILRFPRAACAATSILVVGYMFGILAHYRLILGHGIRYNPRPTQGET